MCTETAVMAAVGGMFVVAIFAALSGYCFGRAHGSRRARELLSN